MNTQATRQVTAFGLAAIVTIALFGGVDSLATRAHDEVALARSNAPAASQVAQQGSEGQVVVITAQRLRG